MIYLDTHVVVWLYAGEIHLFPDDVCRKIDADDLFISPVVLLELQYLKEIKRLTVAPSLIVENLANTIGLQVCTLSFMKIIVEALTHTWTRDPFVRIIAATAAARNASLVTKDSIILKHYPKAFWECAE